jgi:cytochrome c oxidase cbb3-type subunit 3
LLDHDYDGIRELDNVLPPWWVNLFYACIIFAIVYLVRFHIVGDYDQKQEFETEMEVAKVELEKYKEATPDVFDMEKVTQLTDAASLAKGKEIFTNTCAACHRADGGGQIGPNLTDEYWILGGGIKNVFHTLMEGGREGKGMVAWKTSMKPADLQKVASYVLSLQGSKPKDPKPTEPEAKKYVEENTTKDAKAPVADSTKVDTKAVAVK